MKLFHLFLPLFVLLYACKSTTYLPSTTTNTRTDYIATYSDIAIQEMRRTGVPASIKMGQAILESGDGNSTLARRANNHFGIKCHDWTGRRFYYDDDERNECFRRYNKPEESFRDHSDFLKGRSRYAGLFLLDPNDYKAWARGLKAAGYATNPNYDILLIKIIEDNQLNKLDSGSGLQAKIRENGRQETVVVNIGLSTTGREIQTRNRIKYIIAHEGDNYESLTKEMELMKWELSRYNDLPANSNINPGDIIYLQPKRIRAEKGSETHIIGEGETMRYISQLYGVRLNRLLMRNFIQEGHEPSPGDTIFLRQQATREDNRKSFKPEYEL